MFNNRTSQIVRNKVQHFTDKFERGELLGEGGFGSVYKCWRKGSRVEGGKFYALKVLKKDDHKAGWAARLLKNELVILKQMNHPNIVRIYELFQDETDYFIVQELMEGSTILKTIETRPHLFTERQVAKIVAHILKGLEFLHSQCIIHRDIKGENILLDKKMTEDNLEVVAKIADFGLSCYCDPTSKGISLYCGTDLYMAPEMLKLKANPSTLPERYKSNV